MAMKLFVGSLSYNVTSEQLEEVFAAIGTVVSAVVIVDRYSNQSKGFGFVEMSTDDEAKKAIAELNGKEVDGRPIVVNEARPQENRGPRPGGGGGFGGGGHRDGGRGGDRSSSRRY
jgi:RNA recognition motif-containing protein